jgi:hypothetical protein
MATQTLPLRKGTYFPLPVFCRSKWPWGFAIVLAHLNTDTVTSNLTRSMDVYPEFLKYVALAWYLVKHMDNFALYGGTVLVICLSPVQGDLPKCLIRIHSFRSSFWFGTVDSLTSETRAQESKAKKASHSQLLPSATPNTSNAHEQGFLLLTMSLWK